MVDLAAAKDLVWANQEECQAVVTTGDRCDYQDDFFEKVAELEEALSSKKLCCRYFAD